MSTWNRKALIRRWLLLFPVAVIVTWIVAIAGMSILYVFVLTRSVCPPSPEVQTGYQPVQLYTGSGIPLKGWWRAPRNGVVVILLGGHTANRDTMLPEANLLARHGYGSLTIDYRPCAGRLAGLGALELEELKAALDYASSQEGVENVAVLGFSVGGVTAVRGAARYPAIDAVITQGNYDNLLADTVHLDTPVLSPRWQIEHCVALLLWIQAGVWPGDVSPIDDLRKVQQPILMIHGEGEAGDNRAEDQFAAAAGPKELWVVPGVVHGGYMNAAPEEYERRVIDFLDQHFR